MKYALNLADNGRILSATYEKYASEGTAIVDYLPDGNLSDYLYQDGAFLYDPMPDPADSAKAEKIDEIKKNCEDYIYAGTDVTYADGTIEHFTYSLVDQSNISEMFTAVMAGATEYPYHADGEICKIYSKEQIITIYGTLSLFKTEATTYHNSLKAQIKAMTDMDAIIAVKFKETELTGEYLENYASMMASAKAQLEAILARIPTDETTTA